MAIVATNLKKGQCIDYNGEKAIVKGIEHRTPGKGNALIMATVRSFQTGKTKDIRFASGEKVDIVSADRQKLGIVRWLRILQQSSRVLLTRNSL